ncbi:hypothetical protein OG558_09565 [Kribbella sp. NBC_01510]|uniref:hypothetical protein n=1 Tax=Kribbella sp. NBC_01510 TaxID=2903581 RepID=UPI003864AACA
MRLRQGIAAGLLLVTCLVVPSVPASATPAPATAPAAGKKCNTRTINWYTRYGKEVYVGTNLHSDWFEGPGRITYSRTATSESNSAWTGDLGVSVSAVIAEIQSKYSKTVGKSYSVSQNWSYTAEVKAGQVRRLQQLKQSWMVQVVRWRYTTSNCKKTKEISKKTATFPVKNHDYMWILVGQNS